MIPFVDQILIGEILDLGKIHHHAVGGIANLVDDAARQGDFNRIAMPVQMAALAVMVGDAVPGIELEAAGYQHDLLLNKTVADYTMWHADNR